MKKRIFILSLLGIAFANLWSQPNNDCSGAEQILITNSGYDLGSFVGSTVSLAASTLEGGETFPPGVPNAKSVWYSFYIPTTRSVEIILKQTGAPVLNPDDAGWTLYEGNSCIPSTPEVINPPIQNIEGFTHSCLREGWYFVQVGAKLSANGNIFLELVINSPDPNSVDSPYDHCASPYNFQIVSGTSLSPPRLNHYYDVACQSEFEGEYDCGNPDYNKTTWHVFSTDAWVDFFQFEVGENPWNASSPTAREFYYSLYQGDVRSDSTTLTPIETCKTLTQVSSTSYGKCFYTCELDPNTTYSVQLMFDDEYFEQINTRVYETGTNQTISPDPTSIPPSHQLGVLPNAVTQSVSDYFACNGLMTDYLCPPAVLDTVTIGGTSYDMNFWLTFEIPFNGNVTMNLNQTSCGPSPRYIIYAGDVTTGGCGIPIDTIRTSSFTYNCMPAGQYSMQVLGQINETSILNNPCGSNMGDGVNINLTFNQPSQQVFGLHTGTEHEDINGMTPLANEVSYPTTTDFLDCRTTVTPQGHPCNASMNRCIYRTFILGSPGAVTVSGGNWQLSYSIFLGDASTNPIVSNEITGLTDVSGCQGTNFTLCLDPGTYTLVSFGNNADVAVSDNPNILFEGLQEDFGLFNPSEFDDLNGGTPLVSPNQYFSTRDTFDCRTTIQPFPDACAGFNDRAMYRTFTLDQTGMVTLGGGAGWPYFEYRLYLGGADTATISGNDLLNLVPITNCLNLGLSTWEGCLDPGRYTLVTFGDPNDRTRTDRPWVRFEIFSESFGLHTPAEFDDINGGIPLAQGPTYNSVGDTLDCRTTVLPQIICGSNDRAMYRTFTISTSGILNIGGGNGAFQYRLYLGGADTASISGNTIMNLEPVTGCFTWSTSLCIDAERYTLVTFGTESDIGIEDDPTFSFTNITAQLFDLDNPSKNDSLNNGLPLVSPTTYNSTFDQFDCDTTILPAGDHCGGSNDRGIYRRIEIVSSGILTIGGGNWSRFRYRFYEGDAPSLPIVGGEIVGLTDLVGCQALQSPISICITPGIYTLVSFGGPNDQGFGDSPWFHFESFPPTLFTNPASPEVIVGPDVGTPNVSATPTRWNCTDNPLDILGYTPCSGSTKQIYREFYLDRDHCLTFTPRKTTYYPPGATVYYRIFDGRISGPGPDTLSGLERNCFTNSFEACMDSGWYTVVAYTSGDQWSSMGYTSGFGESIGDETWFDLSIDLNFQNYGSFATAENVNGGTPITWIPDGPGGHTTAYPKQFTTYTLGTEYWDCSDNLPFPNGITACDPSDNRTSFRVFELLKDSYVKISNLNPWPGGYKTRLYQGDITASIPPFTIEQECITNDMRLCLPAGFYTLVTFADDSHIKRSITPTIYLDSLGTSKYDHAQNAYDFGAIPNNNTEYFQNLGDANDGLGRPQSNDFFFCSTLSQPSDTLNVCPVGLNPPYNLLPAPTNPRRNLWYTFVVSGGGDVHVSVYNRTIGKNNQSPFAIYKGDNLAIPPVDSTGADGLTYVSRSTTWSCGNWQTVSFSRDNCVATTDRYYILVDNHSSNEPNTQIEVSVRYDPGGGAAVLYDHYSQANYINDLPTTTCNPPYTDTILGTGTVEGCIADLTCATLDPPDQNSCGTKTVWYKLDIGVSGRVRINWTRPNGNTTWNNNDMKLFQEMVPGDSTSSGLAPIPLSSVWMNGNLDFNPGNSYTWGQGCVTPGTYYIMFTGCSNPTETVVPRVWVETYPGDFCSDSLSVIIPDTGQYVIPGRVDCWTIGEAPGEDGTNMECLGGPTGLKSGWFYLNLPDSGKYDVDVEISESTSASALQVKYRVGIGLCDAMTYDECVDEGTFITLNLKCRQDSGIWIQVVLPAEDTGVVELNLDVQPAEDSACIPRDPFAPTSNFDLIGGCENTPVVFTNNSSSGPDITYWWDFGDGFTSTFANPTHTYLSPSTGTFLVTLVTDNGTSTDTAQKYLTLYPQPNPDFSLSPALPIAGGTISPIDLSTNTIPSATYYWDYCAGQGQCSASPPTSLGVNPSDFAYYTTGEKVVCLTVTNGSCDNTICDTLDINLFDLFSGGPFDGFAEVHLYDSCPNPNIFLGGPFDGHQREDTLPCVPVNIFGGGPYDGFDLEDSAACILANIFTGGPYDGFDLDINNNMCTEMVSIWQGGPKDGHAEISEYVCPIPETIFLGGPFDGFAEVSSYSCTPENIFTGGPYDGHQRDDSIACLPINLFTGGPYDGHHRDDTINCNELNIFTGGPYDGHQRWDTLFCEVTNIFSGGPYDGFDVNKANNIQFTSDTICEGESAFLTTNSPTNWYANENDPFPLATNVSLYNTPALSSTTIYWVENICVGTNRVPIIVCVLDSTEPAMATSVNCINENSFFSNQTQVAGPSSPSFGSEIVGFGSPNGTSPNPQFLNFNGASTLNFNKLHDGIHDNGGAWTGNNGGSGTMWAQWKYLNPKSVNRFYYWNNTNPAFSDRAPSQVRLYYSDGGPWKLLKAWFPPSPSTDNFDTGLINEAQTVFAPLWKIEFDVDVANGPQFGEFQVFASDPIIGGNPTWDFGDGSPLSTDQNPVHSYIVADTYDVSLTIDVPGACPKVLIREVIVSDCSPLALLEHNLAGHLSEDFLKIDLNWKVEGDFETAYFQKLVNGQWLNISEGIPYEKDSYHHEDFALLPGKANVYRVSVHDKDGGQNLSNIVTIEVPFNQEFEIKVFPNPVIDQKGFVHFELSEDQRVKVLLFDMLGRELNPLYSDVLKPGSHLLEISYPDVTDGIYFVRVIVGMEVHTERILIDLN